MATYPVVQIGTVVTATGTTSNPSLTPTLAFAPKAQNLVLCKLIIRNVAAAASCSVTPPAGWTLLTSNVPSSAGVSIFVYYNSNITGTSYTFTFASASTSGNRSYALLEEITGVNLTTPLSGSASYVQGTSINATVVTSNSITAGSVGLFPVAIVGGSSNTAVAGHTSGWTEIAAGFNNTGNNGIYETQQGPWTTNSQSVSASVTPSSTGLGTYNFGIFFLQLVGPYVIQPGTVNSAHASAANTLSATPTLTNAPLSSSVVFAFISGHQGTTGATLTLPSGSWTQAGTSDHADGYVTVAWATGVTATSYTFTLNLTGQCYTINAALVEVGRANTTTPINAAISFNPASTGAESDTNSITSIADQSLPLCLFNALVGANATSIAHGWAQQANGNSTAVTNPSSLNMQSGPISNNTVAAASSAVWGTSQANNNGIFFVSNAFNGSFTVSDSLATISETLTRAAQAFARTSADSLASISETLSDNVSLHRSISDGFSAISDVLTRSAQAFSRTSSDAILSIGETLTRASKSLARTASDSLGVISDTITSTLVFVRAASDSLQAISDSVTRGAQTFGRTISDSFASVGETLTRASQAFARSATDTVAAVTDTATRGSQALARSASDAISAITDTVSRSAQAFSRTSADALATVTDTVTRGAQAISRTASDAFSAVSDSVSRSAQSFTRTSSDALTAISETLTGIRVLVRTATDSFAAISDSVSRDAQAFLRNGLDALPGVADMVSRAQQVNRTASDAISSLADTVSRAVIYSRSAVDAISAISDTATRGAIALERTASDAVAAISDTASRAAQAVTRSASDFIASPIDMLTRGPMGFVRGLLDGLAGLLDTVTGRVKRPATAYVVRQGSVPGSVVAIGSVPASEIARAASVPETIVRQGNVI